MGGQLAQKLLLLAADVPPITLGIAQKNRKRKSGMMDRVPAQTSVPDWLMTYCRQLADVHHGRRLNRMYEFMLNGFLRMEPWKASPPLEWRQSRVHGSSTLVSYRGTGGDPGWGPMNMMLPVDLAERIRQTIDFINVNGGMWNTGQKLSMRTFLYTAVYWWCSFVHPYKGPGIMQD